jgi:hypothetical protein
MRDAERDGGEPVSEVAAGDTKDGLGKQVRGSGCGELWAGDSVYRSQQFRLGECTSD